MRRAASLGLTLALLTAPAGTAYELRQDIGEVDPLSDEDMDMTPCQYRETSWPSTLEQYLCTGEAGLTKHAVMSAIGARMLPGSVQIANVLRTLEEFDTAAQVVAYAVDNREALGLSDEDMTRVHVHAILTCSQYGELEPTISRTFEADFLLYGHGEAYAARATELARALPDRVLGACDIGINALRGASP